MDWKREAVAAVMLAKQCPDMVPEYRVPRPRKWWQFWKPVEWVTYRGASVNQIRASFGLPPL